MKLSEILEQVDTLVPNSIAVTTKVSWINQVQNQLYRDYPLPQTSVAINLLSGQPSYPLPADCPEDRIEALVIGEDTYPFVPLNAPPLGQFYAVVNGSLLIYPVPTETGTAVLFYKPRPTQLSASDLTVAPSFPADFHELLVLGCASRVGKTSPQTINLAAVFDQDYRMLEEKADLVIRRRQPNKVAIHRSWA